MKIINEKVPGFCFLLMATFILANACSKSDSSGDRSNSLEDLAGRYATWFIVDTFNADFFSFYDAYPLDSFIVTNSNADTLKINATFNTMKGKYTFHPIYLFNPSTDKAALTQPVEKLFYAKLGSTRKDVYPDKFLEIKHGYRIHNNQGEYSFSDLYIKVNNVQKQVQDNIDLIYTITIK